MDEASGARKRNSHTSFCRFNGCLFWHRVTVELFGVCGECGQFPPRDRRSLSLEPGLQHLMRTANNLKVALAFAAIYIIWGSTFYAVSIALKSFPPFLLSTLRMLI